MTSEVETNIVAVERIKEYSEAVQVWKFNDKKFFIKHLEGKYCLH